MNKIKPVERLKQIYETTIESGDSYLGNLDEIDFYTLLCKSTASNNLYKLLSCNLFMFKFKYQKEDSVLIVFSIPMSLNMDSNQENKHISERILEILKMVEDCFSTVDYMNLKNVKEDKFVYMTVVKKIPEE